MATGLRYPGKVVIVTGGTSGIGLATVREFVRQGAKVVFCSRAVGALLGCLSPNGENNQERGAGVFKALSKHDVERGRAIQRELQDSGCPGEACYQVCDVRKESDIKRLIAVTIECYGRLDCLVNNAGSGYFIITDDEKAQGFCNTMELNTMSGFLASKYALPYLRETRGNIVNIGGLVGESGMKDCVSFCSSRAAIIAMTKCMAIEESKNGVRVNSVSPANIQTPVWKRLANQFPDPEALIKEIQSCQLLGRMGTPEEVALAVLFLAADGTYCTGSDLLVTGGAEVGFGIKCPLVPGSYPCKSGNLQDPFSQK